jgi:hypothetical protein
MVSFARSSGFAATLGAIASALGAQQPSKPTAPAATAAAAPAASALSLAELKVFAETQLAIAIVLDSSGKQLAQVKNKTVQAHAEMQKNRQQLVAAALSKRGLTEAEFERRRFIVSTDNRARYQLDSIVAGLTGQPLPGRVVVVASPEAGPPTSLPMMAVGYIGTRYLDTPDKSGLIAMGMTEAKVAAQHAGFMARAPQNLQALQMHAGHVLHAIDPTTMPTATAPGKGYGVKRAMDGVIAYAEFAAASAGVSANVKTHSVHVIAAARNTLKRADMVIAMARRIQSASSAEAASKLVGELQSLCEELVAGSDINHDGKIVWGEGEGGMQQAQDHLNLLIAGEKKPT